MHAVHVSGTKVLIRAMEAAGVRRLILASTSGTVAVRKSGGRPATESDRAPIELIGRWPYYMSKFLQEREVLDADGRDRIEATVLNPSLLVGPGDTRLSSTGDILKILHGRIPALTDGTVAFVDVRDCAPAFVVALTKGRRGERYLLNGANVSVRNFAERVATAGGRNPPRLKLPDRWARVSARVMEGAWQALDLVPPIDAVSVEMGTHHWGCSSAKAERELGFRARDPQASLHDTVRDLERRGLFRR
jgi:dihydroflavonol-4-reductase